MSIRRALLLVLILGFISLTACEDVIEVQVRPDAGRLIVDALIRVHDTATTTQVIIDLKNSASYFETLPPATGATVALTKERDPGLPATVILVETEPGIYRATVATTFLVNDTITLRIKYADKSYVATANYVTTVPIDQVKQGDGSLFSGDETEILISFTDSPNQSDYYLFDLDFGQYLVTEDTFYPGQTFTFSYFYDIQLNQGRALHVSLLGADLRFYNYMEQLIVQANSGAQGPFGTPTTTVRGNIIKVDEGAPDATTVSLADQEYFALGYFAIAQVYSKTIVIE